MVTLAIAYIVVWVAAVAYVGWLGMEQRRLSKRLAELEDRLEVQMRPTSKTSKAA